MIRIIFICFFLTLSLEAKDKVETIQVDDMPMFNVARLISELSGLNIVPSAQSSKVLISAYLVNMKAKLALKEICWAHNIWMEEDEDSGVIRLYTLEEYKSMLSDNFLREEVIVFDLKFPNAKVVSRVLKDIYSDRIVINEEEDESREDEIEEIEHRLKKLEIFEEKGVTGSGATNSNSRSSQTNQTSESDRLEANQRDINSQINGINEQSNLPKNQSDSSSIFRKALEKARSFQEIQRIKEDQENYASSKIYLSLVEEKNQVIVRSTDHKIIKAIGKLIRSLDKPSPMVLLEMRILSVILNDSFSSAFDLAYSIGKTKVSMDPGQIQANGGLTYARLDSKLELAFNLLEKEQKAKVLATPLILTLNREVGKFFIGTNQVPLLTGFTPGTAVAVNGAVTQTTVIPQYTLIDIGTTLKVSPTINANRTVQLQISSVESDLSRGSVSILVPNTDANGNVTLVSREVDAENRRTFTGTVLASDGKLMAVGGIIKETDEDAESGVPVLRKVPVLKTFFSDKRKLKQREELVILIRPHIIYTEKDFDHLGDDLLNRLKVSGNVEYPISHSKIASLNKQKNKVSSIQNKKPKSKSRLKKQTTTKDNNHVQRSKNQDKVLVIPLKRKKVPKQP